MKQSRQERLLKKINRQVGRRIRFDVPGSVNKTIQEAVAEQRLAEFAERVRREGIR